MMPCAVDYILEGLAKNLELKRELGGFVMGFDRDFLATLPKERAVESGISGPGDRSIKSVTHAAPATSAALQPCSSATSVPSAALLYDYVFLHHGPITGPGVEMMARLVTAMKRSPESAPIVFTGEKPAAKIYIVLGAKALAKWYGEVALAYGGWFKDADSEVLLVYSPEDIYRFGVNLSSAMIQKKREMWRSLQEAMRKVS